jgi:hypothetical protein
MRALSGQFFTILGSTDYLAYAFVMIHEARSGEGTRGESRGSCVKVPVKVIVPAQILSQKELSLIFLCFLCFLCTIALCRHLYPLDLPLVSFFLYLFLLAPQTLQKPTSAKQLVLSTIERPASFWGHLIRANLMVNAPNTRLPCLAFLSAIYLVSITWGYSGTLLFPPPYGMSAS